MDTRLLAIAGGSTLVYAVLATMMAVLPGIELSATPPTDGLVPLTPIQAQGRDVYVSEGCAYCHTQQVRPLPVDKIFGRPSAAGDFAFSTPELLGSERTGPDLTNIGARQSSTVWQYIHLYNPRAVVPQSVMPSFSWMFKHVAKAPDGMQAVPVPPAFRPAGGEIIPGEDAVALVEYLLSLKQPALPGGASTATPAASAAPTAAAPATAAPTSGAASAAGAPAAAPGFDAAQGTTLFAAHCAACHGAEGAGVPGVFPHLVGNPVVMAKDPTEHIDVVLHGLHGKEIDGVKYAAEMPSFAGQLSDAQIADIIGHERTSWGNQAPTVSAADVAAQRAKQ